LETINARFSLSIRRKDRRCARRGVIGASWAALFLANGLTVIVSDPDPHVQDKVDAVISGAQPSPAALGFITADMTRHLSFETDNQRAAANAAIVQECGPERVDFKQDLWKRVEEAAPKDALLCSSSSSIPASVQGVRMTDPARLLIGHPLNTPHLMPLVEVAQSPATDPAITQKAIAFYASLGKAPLLIGKEVPGFVANRLQAAIFQECVHLMQDAWSRSTNLTRSSPSLLAYGGRPQGPSSLSTSAAVLAACRIS